MDDDVDMVGPDRSLWLTPFTGRLTPQGAAMIAVVTLLAVLSWALPGRRTGGVLSLLTVVTVIAYGALIARFGPSGHRDRPAGHEPDTPPREVVMTGTGVLRAAVIGAGSGSLSIAALARSARFDLIAVADTDPAALARLAREQPPVALFGSAEDLLAAGGLDVVCVSTYAPTHLPLAVAALDHGIRGLLVEKPLSPTTAEARTLLDLAAKKAVPVVVPHGLMAMSAPLQIIDRIRRGDIGELRFVEIECTGWDIINAGIHWLQYFLAVTEGDPARTVLTAADASTRTFRDGMQVETEAVTLVRTSSGIRLFMNTGDDIPLARPGAGCLMRFVGGAGVLEYVAWEQAYSVIIEGRPAETVAVEPFTVSGHQRHLEHLADLVTAGRTDTRIPELSLRALELVEAAYLSHRRRAAVVLPLTVAAAGRDVDDPPTWSPGQPYDGVGGGRNGRQL